MEEGKQRRPKPAAARFAPPPSPSAFGPRLRARKSAPASAQAADASEMSLEASGLSLHDLFARQAAEVLDRTDLDEAQKQSVLVAINCPSCGGGMSYTAKLKGRHGRSPQSSLGLSGHG
jgi:uncharacterized protein YbbK (DUF523 family)